MVYVLSPLLHGLFSLKVRLEYSLFRLVEKLNKLVDALHGELYDTLFFVLEVTELHESSKDKIKSDRQRYAVKYWRCLRYF